jgi:hypothetical protein
MVSADGQVWLRVAGLAFNEVLSLTLTAPDGTACPISKDRMAAHTATNQGPVEVQAFVTPKDCAGVEGVWTATFDDGAGNIATARFLAVSDLRPAR